MFFKADKCKRCNHSPVPVLRLMVQRVVIGVSDNFPLYRSMQFSLCNVETSMARNINKNKLGLYLGCSSEQPV